MNLPAFTVVITTYQRPDLLTKALESCVLQTYPNLSILVSDDCSGDDTFCVVKRFCDPRIMYFCNSSNVGAQRNLALAISRVNTPFFSILSDDDYLMSDFVDRAMNSFALHPGANLFASSVIAVDIHGFVIDYSSLWPLEGQLDPCDSLPLYLEHNLAWQGVAFRKHYFDMIGGLDLSSLESFDFELLTRALLHSPILYERRPGAIWRFHASNTSTVSTSKSLLPGWFKAWSILRFSDSIPEFQRVLLSHKLLSVLSKKLFWKSLVCLRESNFADYSLLFAGLMSIPVPSVYRFILSFMPPPFACTGFLVPVLELFTSIKALFAPYRRRKVSVLDLFSDSQILEDARRYLA